MTFNWSNAPREVCEKRGINPGPLSHQQAYHEVGHPRTLAGKDKIFALERRGGYPWAEGAFGRNDGAPLPAALANDGRPTRLAVRICDNVRADADRVRRVIVRAVLFGARDGDEVEARVNGVPVSLIARDPEGRTPGYSLLLPNRLQEELIRGGSSPTSNFCGWTSSFRHACAAWAATKSVCVSWNACPT